MNTVSIHPCFANRSPISQMMRRVEGMIERHQNGELVPAKYKHSAEERKPSTKQDPDFLKRLYYKAVNEGRTLSSVGLEANITTNNLYRWAHKQGLEIPRAVK